MPSFVIAMGAAPHLRLVGSGREFSASGEHMTFDSHEAAYDYILAHIGEEPLKGIRTEIVEDVSDQDHAPQERC